jgi:hypothetical protein
MSCQEPQESKEMRSQGIATGLSLGISIILAMTLLVIFSQHGHAQRPLKSEVDKELRALLIARRDVWKEFLESATARDQIAEHRGDIDILRLNSIRQEFYKAELELAESKEDRIRTLLQALESQSHAEEIVAVRSDSMESSYYLKADRLRIEIELHKEKKKP